MADPLVVNIGKPYSLDPMEYDYAIHHIVQRPILATLVSQYKTGDLKGVLASDWTVSEDKRRWTFRLRENLTFEDGTPIDGPAIKSSLTRTAYLMRQKGSKSGILDHLKDFSSLKSPKENFAGITATQASVTLCFEQEPSKVLERLSFGLYAIAHSEDFDSDSGAWKDPKRAISSGPYSASSWDNDELALSARSSFPLESIYGNDRPFTNIVFSWKKTCAFKPDIVFGEITDPPDKTYQFRSGLLNNIIFVRLLGHASPNSPIHRRDFRRKLRQAFYESLKEQDTAFTTSFLPLSIPGTKALEVESLKSCASMKSASSRFSVCTFNSTNGFREKILRALVQAASNSLLSAHKVDLPSHQIASLLDPSATRTACDAIMLRTGVSIDDPWDDLRFMVKSHEGIRLPDPTGRLQALVDNACFDPQALNQFLWDDAIVWPVAHTASGLWVLPHRVDTSILNLDLPPTDLSLIRRADEVLVERVHGARIVFDCDVTKPVASD